MYLALNDTAAASTAVEEVVWSDANPMMWKGTHRKHACFVLTGAECRLSSRRIGGKKLNAPRRLFLAGKDEGDYSAVDWAHPDERGWTTGAAFLSSPPPYGKLAMLWAPRLVNVFGLGCPDTSLARQSPPTSQSDPWAWLRDQDILWLSLGVHYATRECDRRQGCNETGELLHGEHESRFRALAEAIKVNFCGAGAAAAAGGAAGAGGGGEDDSPRRRTMLIASAMPPNMADGVNSGRFVRNAELYRVALLRAGVSTLASSSDR